MAMGKSSGKKCAECGTEHSVQRGDCMPLEVRKGPDVTSPNHPSNNGSWRRLMDAMWNVGIPC